MRIAVYAYMIALCGLLLTGCRKSNDIEEQRLSWSTDAPLTIPYRVRWQRHERNNLVRNPSFETGKIFKLDSLTTSFAIDGWQQIGQHVQWVDIKNDSVYHYNEAYSGIRAVKIKRKRAYETDEQGEGILSDFIKVIPGNYQLSLYMRLENVKPGKSRLGTRMFDGIDIKVLYYDRNKIQIRKGHPFPQEDQVINHSFKALSFSNYSSIPAFGWGKVTGKSHYYPFPEGDIPTEAHFVKIFVGLKGTGTLWVDSVNFHYTSDNFSVPERMNAYTDTSFQMTEALIPTPKELRRMESIIYYKPGMKQEHMPVILVKDMNDLAVMRAARLIQTALQQGIDAFSETGGSISSVDIHTDQPGSLPVESSLIISIGETRLYKQYQNVLPVHAIQHQKDGYFIYSPGDQTSTILLGANNSNGLYYAALTITQLIDGKAPVLHNARIVDYPDFAFRYSTFRKPGGQEDMRVRKEFINELISYKYNGALLLNADNDFTLSKNHLQENDVNELYSIVPVAGYFPPGDSTLTYSFPLDLTAFQFDANSTVSLLMPPAFHNQMLDNSNFIEMCFQMNANAKLLYSGSSFFSINTDAADIQHYTSVMGAFPVFMDNSMLIASNWGHSGRFENLYPGKTRLFNLFEPYSNADIREYFPYLDSSMFIVNLPATSEIEMIRLATAAEFLWNSKTYSAEYSLWKVLTSRYGAENARDLILYTDKYGLLLEMMIRFEMKAHSPRNMKAGQQVMSELTSILAVISDRLGTQNKLVKELQSINAGLRSRLNRNAGLLPVKK